MTEYERKFKDYLETQYHLSDKTKYDYLRNIINLDLSSPKNLLTNLQKILETKSVSTYNNMIKALRKFRYALQAFDSNNHLLPTILGLKSKKVNRSSSYVPYSFEEVRKILKLTNGWRHQALWIALNTGLRLKEINNLNIEDVDTNNGIITVRKGKGNKRRYVFVQDTSVLKRWKMVRNLRQIKGDHWLFNSFGDRPNMSVSLGYAKLTKKVGFKVSLHRCRSTYTTHTYNQGDNHYGFVKKQLGHSSPQSTNKYIQIPDHLRKKKINQIEKLYQSDYKTLRNQLLSGRF